MYVEAFNADRIAEGDPQLLIAWDISSVVTT